MRERERREPEVRPDLSGAGQGFAILVSRYNREIGEELLAAARDGLLRHGVDAGSIEVEWVPGAFELPVAARWAAESGRFAAVLGLGCVIKGETDHDVYINHAVAQAFQEIGLATGVPVVLGVLTVNDREQARARADRSHGGGKGWECALAALEMAALRRRLAGPSRSGNGG